jgi:hypothetical protein
MQAPSQPGEASSIVISSGPRPPPRVSSVAIVAIMEGAHAWSQRWRDLDSRPRRCFHEIE